MSKKLREFTVWFYVPGKYGLVPQMFTTKAANISIAIQQSLKYAKLGRIFKVEGERDSKAIPEGP